MTILALILKFVNILETGVGREVRITRGSSSFPEPGKGSPSLVLNGIRDKLVRV
jgi:hypothetical protein